MRYLDVNTQNLKELADNGRLKDFAYFLYLKSLYSNSCIFNYTQKSLSVKSKLPVSRVKSCVKSFLDSGWCRIHRGNLVFNKLKSFDHQKRKKIVRVNVSNVKQILKDLYKLILNNAEDKFKVLTKISADLLNSHPKIRRAAQRKADKLNLDTSKLPGEGDLISLSMNKISKLLGCSVGSSAAVIKEFKSNGSIWCVTERKIISSMPSTGVKAFMNYNPNTYYHNGNLFIVSCNKYIFNK